MPNENVEFSGIRFHLHLCWYRASVVIVMIIRKLVLRTFKDGLNYDDAYIVLEGEKYGVIKIANHNFDESVSISTEELLKQGGSFIIPLQWDDIRDNICFDLNKTTTDDEAAPESTCNYYVMRNGLWGILDEFGKDILEPFYEEVIITNYYESREVVSAKCHLNDFDSLSISGCVVVRKNDKWGLLGSYGDIILPIEYDSIGIVCYHWASSDVFIVCKKGLYGVVDQNGKFLISLTYSSLYCDDLDYMWNCTVFRTESEAGIGYVRLGDGKCLVAPEWDRIDVERLYFHPDAEPYGHIFTVWKGNKCGLVFDDKGLLISPEWDEIIIQRIGFNDPLSYSVRKGKYWGCYDANGFQICDAVWDEIGAFYQGVACVKKNGQWGAIGVDGQLRVPVEWDEIEGFGIKESIIQSISDDTIEHRISIIRDLPSYLSWVWRDGLCGIIDKNGSIVEKPIWEVHDNTTAFISGAQRLKLLMYKEEPNTNYKIHDNESCLISSKSMIGKDGVLFHLDILKMDKK